MPFIELKLFKSRVEDDEVAAKIIRAVTGVPPKRWGSGGGVES